MPAMPQDINRRLIVILFIVFFFLKDAHRKSHEYWCSTGQWLCQYLQSQVIKHEHTDQLKPAKDLERTTLSSKMKQLSRAVDCSADSSLNDPLNSSSVRMSSSALNITQTHTGIIIGMLTMQCCAQPIRHWGFIQNGCLHNFPVPTMYLKW